MSDRLDIRVGDLVKATRKDDPEQVIVSRVGDVDQSNVELKPTLHITVRKWDFEVLDRPLPVIPKDLFEGVHNVWRDPRHRTVREALTAVIHHVNEYNNKKGTNA